MLFCQGERDAFGNEKENRDIIKKLRLDAKCLVIEGGDHSFKVPKSLRSQEKVYEAIMDEVAEWRSSLKKIGDAILSSYKFVQLDVFTDQAFARNPLAVFPEAEGLSDERMQQIAREMNLSETVFVLPSEKEGVLRRLRIFTPGSELPFAGHPIVGTWNCLAREGVVPLPENGNGRVRLKHEVGIGVLPIEIDFQDGAPVSVTMTQGKFEIRGEIDDSQEQA